MLKEMRMGAYGPRAAGGRLCPLAALLLALGSLAGCGSDADTIVSIPPTVTSSSTTSTSATTTTTATSTTSTLPEIEVEAPPEFPTAGLTEAYGGPLPIESVCLNLDVAPRVIDSELLRSALRDSFRFMGIEVVNADCDLDVDISLQGGRYSDNYAGLGECFTGYTIEGVIAASAAGQELSLPIDIDRETPFTISGCRGDEEPPGGPVPRVKVDRAVAEALEALLGPIARLAIPFGSQGPRTFSFAGDSSDLTVVDLLVSALYMDDPQDRCRVVEVAGGWEESSPGEAPDLMPLVPHLIATYLDMVEIDYDTYLSGESGLWDCDGNIEFALFGITRQDDLWGPAEWATWWMEETGN